MIRSILPVVVLVLLLSGCRDPKQQASVTWDQEPTDYTLLIIIDPDTINKKIRVRQTLSSTHWTITSATVSAPMTTSLSLAWGWKHL